VSTCIRLSCVCMAVFIYKKGTALALTGENC
jgi:hypothetical protein